MPGQSSQSRQMPAPATSKTRVGGLKPNSAMLARLMLRTMEAEQLTRLWSAVGTWPSQRTLDGSCLSPQPSPPRMKRACGARVAARRKSSSTRASRSGRRLPRKTTSQARVGSGERVPGKNASRGGGGGGGEGVVGFGVEAVVHAVVGLGAELAEAVAGEG